ncbi:VWA domain-containing protein [Nonomuraea sp. NPDC026600]|uniref:VWA domain-containing protein n=1 Tax=Nonomuraea sp. NPDC026600 TaxID=3155363 RepID=UPI003400EB80
MTGPTKGTGPGMSLGRLRESAAPWLNRPAGPPPAGRRVVDSTDRADLAALDQIMADCTALATLEDTLADQYGAAGLVEDLWLAAYSRDPQLADAHQVAPGQSAGRAIAAAMLGTPEHQELRRATVGDPYAAAMSVLAQGRALRQMLGSLDAQGRPRVAHQAHQAADRAADAVQQAYAAAAGAVEDTREDDPAVLAGGAGGADGAGVGDLGDADVPHPLVAAVQRAIADAQAADAAAAGADAAVADQQESGDMAVAMVRAAARKAVAEAEAELSSEAAAMNAWGVGEGERQRLGADERMALARRLRGGKLARFAELIGRFRQMSTAQRSRRVEHARSEYIGVTLGDDLGSLVPGELVGLALPALRAQFAVRYAERQLMVYEQRGDDHEAQGAIIACIDCSYSMYYPDEHGITGEAYAKAMALALLDQARDATPPRDFAAILFSDTAEPAIRFPADKPVSLEDKITMAELFPGGGTAFQPPLDAAVKLLDAEYNTAGKQKADIVFITDGAAEMDDAWLATWRQAKKRLAFRCFGISIGEWAEPERALEEICDDVRRIEDLTDTHATADLFRAI